MLPDQKAMRISVITPVLNKAAYIERCFQSMDQQSHNGFEHIIVDGGSQDGTVELINNYASKRPNVIWISKPDRGQSHAMNRGLGLAQGHIIGFLNADDYYEPEILMTVNAAFRDIEGPSILFGNCVIWNDKSEIWGVHEPKLIDVVEWLLPDGEGLIPVNPVQYFYSTDVHSLIGYFDEDEHYVMDMDFLFRAIQVAKHRYINRVFGNFRLISGTKTLSDIQASTADARLLRLKHKYIGNLPLRMRLIYEGKRIARHLPYFSNRRSSNESAVKNF
jgi:glycosyltransferase involved in cell wall biosynthesis